MTLDARADARFSGSICRLRGAGYKTYKKSPYSINQMYNRHWFRHIIVAFSPSGILPLPLPFWLGFPEGILRTCYHMGMVRQFLYANCAPKWNSVEKISSDLQSVFDRSGLGNVEEAEYLTEELTIKWWVKSMIEYVSWYSRMSVDLWQPVEVLLDPPAACFTPERKDQLSKYNKYGLLFRCYDLVRERSPPLPLPEKLPEDERVIVSIDLSFGTCNSVLPSHSF